MAIKIVVVVLFLAILASLGSGLLFMLRDDAGSNRAIKALTWRISLSVAVFILLLLGAWMGWIEPNTP